MIETFKQLEEIASDRDLAEVFLETDEQEHGIPGDQILEALRKRRQVMRECVERGKGGGTHQSIHAAALALKNTLGLVCDPVGGLVEVPCVKRNALFAVHGLTAAQLAMAGVDSVIPMDEIVEAMVRIGRALPRGLKETAEGGLATTLTGCEIGQRLKDEANQRRAERAAERERVAKERKSGSTLS